MPVVPVLHCDLDSFYASVEQSVRPNLRGMPVAISAPRGQSVITAASYEAKAKGVRVGVPLREAYKRCPELTFLTARMDAYQRAGMAVREIIRSCVTEIETLGIDECFIDLRNVDREACGAPTDADLYDMGENGLAAHVARHLRGRVKQEMGLDMSVGGGSNKTVAKLACDRAKPNGMLLVSLDDELEFLHQAIFDEIPGIGPKSIKRLHSMGASRLSDVIHMSETSLVATLGKRQGQVVHAMMRNEFRDPVAPNAAQRTTSSMRSFGAAGADAHDALEDLLAEILARLSHAGAAARSLSVFAADEGNLYQGKHDTGAATSDVRELTVVARRMIQAVPKGFRVRYAGITLEGLSKNDQLRLDVPIGASDGELLAGELRVPQESEAERLQRSAYWGMPVSHATFGPGRLVALETDAVVVKFADRERHLALWAPISFSERPARIHFA